MCASVIFSIHTPSATALSSPPYHSVFRISKATSGVFCDRRLRGLLGNQIACDTAVAARLGCLSVFVTAMEALIRRWECNKCSGTTNRVQLRYSRPIAPLLPLPCVAATLLHEAVNCRILLLLLLLM
ncbi:unnamed protein product [Lactuca saligna]|uniref:Uncharacterized protein n=1 Tax=Lactuca saligna TaxID=75948 RepID=A0AA36DZ45_LACSI|nr:unnamed protein product [Lactuca saligna]